MAVFYKTKILFEKLEGIILLHYDLRENNKTQNWAACKTDIKSLKQGVQNGSIFNNALF